jgi:ABC-2 type transport system ATP-binding protein
MPLRRAVTCTAVAVAALASQGAPAAARDATVTSFDGTRIATHFFPAAGLAPGEQAPTVLVGHGWGGEGDTDPNSASSATTGNTGLGPLRKAGFNVLTWDARGFGKSGGQAMVDSPRHEGRDVQALLTWLAGQPEARMEAPGDPLVGMSGVSYGGAIQLITAAIDKRVDAIAPTIAWHLLTRSLYRDGAVKQGWGSLLVAAGSSALTGGLGGGEAGNLDPQILQAFQEGTTAGVFSQQSVDYFAARGIDRLEAQIEVPTLIVQGTVDTLFTLQEGIDNYTALSDNGIPLKMIWFCGGHGICTLPAGPASFVEDSVVTWLRRHLKGQRIATGARFQWVADDGQLRSSSAFPLSPRPPLRGTGSGLLAISPGSPVTGVGALIAATPAADAVNVSIEPAGGERELVGAPRVKITYSGIATPAETFLYAQVVDTRANRVLGNQVTPIPVTLDGQQHTVERTLEPIAVHATPTSRYRLQVAGGTTVYGLQRSSGSASLTRIEAALPVRAAAASGDAAKSETVRLILGKARGLAEARPKKRPVRVPVRARGGDIRRIRVVLRKRGGKVLGRSGHFRLSDGERKVAKVRVRRKLPVGRFTIRASGITSPGKGVRSSAKRARLRR